MTEQKTIPKAVIKLHEPVLDYAGEPIREPQRLQAKAEDVRGKTDHEIRQMSPILTIGEIILRILATSVKPLNVEENGDLYIFIKKVRNKMTTGKGEWQIEQDELKKLQGFIKRCEGQLASPTILGQIIDLLETTDLELRK